MYQPDTLAGIWLAAVRIREENPLKGKTMTNPEAIRQGQAISKTLEVWKVQECKHDKHGNTIAGEHVWHTAVKEDGTVCGIWADNETEAALKLMVSWGRPIISVTRDAECLLHNKMKRDAKAAEKMKNAADRRRARVHDRYNDAVTTPARLRATKQDGMLI